MSERARKKSSNQDIEIDSPEPTDRRRLIIRSLSRCIREKGYTKTSLTDIAVAAGMSPSHIRYYFDGKDAILESYLRESCAGILEGIRNIPTDDPDSWMKEFTAYFIANSWITPARLSVMVEIFGISVHDPALRRIKAGYDSEIRSILEGYFARVGCAENISPKAAAEIAQSLEAGLKYNAVFQQDYSPQRARKLFSAGIDHLTARDSPRKAQAGGRARSKS